MNRILNIATFTAGFLFFINGVMWLIAPAASAEALDMPLLSGEGLSTQIGDISSFFLVLGSFILLGAYTKKKYWFYAPIALLSLAAISRTIAYLFHGADFSTDKIVVEVVVAAFLLFVVKKV